MTALIVTVITSILEIVDQLFGQNWSDWKESIEIFLAVITPILVWLLPHIRWSAPWPGGAH